MGVGTIIAVGLVAALVASGLRFSRNRRGAETGLDNYLPAELLASGPQHEASAAYSNADRGNAVAEERRAAARKDTGGGKRAASSSGPHEQGMPLTHSGEAR